MCMVPQRGERKTKRRKEGKEEERRKKYLGARSSAVAHLPFLPPSLSSRVEQNNFYTFEFPTFLIPTNLGQPMHSPPALTKHVSLNLAGAFLLDPVPASYLEKQSKFI